MDTINFVIFKSGNERTASISEDFVNVSCCILEQLVFMRFKCKTFPLNSVGGYTEGFQNRQRVKLGYGSRRTRNL
jgi:hypothetical protein